MGIIYCLLLEFFIIYPNDSESNIRSFRIRLSVIFPADDFSIRYLVCLKTDQI